MKTKKVKLDLSIERKNAIEAGFFDGRFVNKVIPNKKKQAQKRWARSK